MRLQAFIDDSYTKDVFVLAGYIASADTWLKFSQQWQELLSYGVREKDGSFYFKMSEMTQSLERIERVPAFHRIIAQNGLLGISVKIDRAQVNSVRSKLSTAEGVIDWGLYDIDYIVAFRCLIDVLHERREHFAPRIAADDVIDFTFDDQQEKKIILSIWEEYLEARSEKARKLFGASPRFENDKVVLPLQAADLWAGVTRIWYETGKPSVMPLGTSKVWSINYLSLYSITMEYDEKSIEEGLKSMLDAKRDSAKRGGRSNLTRKVILKPRTG